MTSRTTPRAVTTDQRWTLGLASVGSFLVILDLLAVSTALPTLRTALNATITTLDWTINAYTITFAVLLMTAAALGDRWGRRRVYAGGLLLFTGASVACALAPNAGVLIGARAVQGVGAAVTMATALALINTAFAPERRGWAMGVFGAATGAASTLGPVLGGVLTQLLSWPAIFWINVPVGLAAAVGVALRVRDGQDRTARPLDLSGLLLGGAAVLALVWGVIRAATDGWTDRTVIGALVLGVLLLGALLLRERRTEHPMIPPRLFTDRAFTSGIVGIFLQSASLTAIVFFTAQFLQNAQHDGPLEAGLHLLPLGLVPLLLAPRTGARTDRVGTRPMIVIGLALQTAGTAVLAVLAGPDLPYVVLGAAVAVVATGVTFAVPALTKSVVGSVQPADIGTASGLFSTVRQVGAAFGVAASSAAFTAAGGYGDVAAGYRAAMIVAVAAVGIAVVTPPSRRSATARRSRRGR
jgi:EmrB/QacA subfamily drug resistance transporter